MYIDTAAGGKFALRANDIQVNNNTDVYVPVMGYKTQTLITFNSGVADANCITVNGVDGNVNGYTINWSDTKNVMITSYTYFQGRRK